ncbi:MAG: branched-chain amino acid ABC transporter substrate-binding protein [Chloroflexota bacterium]
MKKLLIFALLLMLMALSIPATMAQPECTDAIGCVEIEAGDPVVIGYMLTVSGPTAFLGEDSVGGIELAVMDRGEFLGTEIEIVGEDSLCSAEGGQTAAQRIASDDEIAGVVGTNCSSAATAALPIISEAGLVMISPSATSPTLSDADMDAGGVYLPGFYRTAHNDLFQGAIAAQFIAEELGAASLATIHDGSSYADGLQGVMADVFASDFEGTVTFQGAVNIGDTDMTAILTEIAADAPDVLYFPIFEPEGNFIADQALDIAGLEDTILFGADGILVDSFPENTGDASVGMYFSGPVVTGEAYQSFLAAWEEEIGGVPPSGFHAHAYDATNMLLDSIEAVAVMDDEGNISIGRQALRDELTAIEEFEGLTGVLTCSETGDCSTGEALGIFQTTEAELEGNWPPPVIWTPAGGMMEME